MRKLLFGLLFSLGLGAQTITLTQPDCVIFFGFTATGQTQPLSPFAGYDNRQVGCTTWAVTYSISGFSSITVALQGAPNSAGAPGSWATFPGQTIVTGSNPNTITSGEAFLWLYGYNPWIRVALTAATGSGVVSGSAFGYRVPSASSSGATTIVTIPPVPDLCAPGQPGAAEALFNLSGSGNTRIVTGTASKQIRVCHVYLQTGTAENIKFTQGTKVSTDCDTTPTDLTGLFQTSLGFAFDPTGSLAAGSGLDLCINQSNAQALGGWIAYAVF